MQAHFYLKSQQWLPAFFQEVADSYANRDFQKLQALALLQETLEENPSAHAFLDARFQGLWFTPQVTTLYDR